MSADMLFSGPSTRVAGGLIRPLSLFKHCMAESAFPSTAGGYGSFWQSNCVCMQGRWSDDERNGEGPAARAVRNLEQQVAAAEEKATTGSVDMPTDERRD